MGKEYESGDITILSPLVIISLFPVHIWLQSRCRLWLLFIIEQNFIIPCTLTSYTHTYIKKSPLHPRREITKPLPSWILTKRQYKVMCKHNKKFSVIFLGGMPLDGTLVHSLALFTLWEILHVFMYFIWWTVATYGLKLARIVKLFNRIVAFVVSHANVF